MVCHNIITISMTFLRIKCDIMMPVMRLTHSKSFKMILKYCFHNVKPRTQTRKLSSNMKKYFHNTGIVSMDTEKTEQSIAIFDATKYRKKEKSTFLDVLYTYMNEGQRKTGHVSFVYAALRYMDEFGVNEDLDVYKEILDTMPKGRYVATTLLQAEFMHYPREQQCIIDLLEKMENNGVIPDPEMELMVINICGKYSFPLRKLRRMAYWQTKFKNLNPWPIPRPLSKDPLELANLAIQKIASVDVQSVVTIFDANNVENSIDKTWIVSASSPDQERLISQHPTNVAAYVEGPHRIWVSKASVDYFVLRADVSSHRYEENIDLDDVSNLDISLWSRSKKKLAYHRSIHEQNEQIIFGICATGTSSRDSLLSWVRCLQPRNPALISIPILFKFIRLIDESKMIDGGEMKASISKEISSKETMKNINS